jgi:predicted transcriptional regulator
MEMRTQLLMGLEHWLEKSRITQAEAAKVLGVTQARVSDLKRGKIDRFRGPAGALGGTRGTQTQTEIGGVRKSVDVH